MKRGCWVRLLGFFLLVGLTSCGGGGGGGSGGDNDAAEQLPYTGLATPAILDSSNVVEITEMATYGTEDISNYPPDITGAALSAKTASKMALVTRTDLADVVQAARYEENWTEVGPCGGQMTIAMVANESTGEFSATIVANDYCENGETMDGEMELSGVFDENMFLSSMTIHFALVTITDAEDDFTISGTIAENFTGPNAETNLTINYRDNTSAKVYRFENYLIATAYVEQGYTENMTGRFFHPDYGYVDVTTAAPFTFVADDFPVSGEAVCSGTAAQKSKFTALSATTYKISADFDGNGDFADFSTMFHYPGRNTLPVISAGDDFSGNVGCGDITVSGATAADADTDPLTLAWTFVSKPSGSAAAINGAGTLTPSFSPDLAGQYILLLSVSDSVGINVEDTVTVTVYGDLFCLNAKTFIPAAQASKPAAVAVGDVTGDGRNDVVFLTSSTERVDSDPNQDYHLSVFAQTTQGGLAAPLTYPAGDGSSLVIADFNGDGRNDIAVSCRTGVGLFYQTLPGTLATMQLLPFGETIAGYEPHSVFAADFTGDGRSDLASVYSDFTAAKIRLYAQTESGALGAPSLFTTDPGLWLAKAEDLNGDQRTDLILTSNELGKGSVFIGAFAKLLSQSGGTLTAPVTYLYDNSLSPYSNCSGSFALANLNGDVRPDLVTSCLEMASQTSTFLRLYPQQEDRTVGAPLTFASPATYGQLEAVELTGDTLAELLGLASGNQMVFDVFRQGSGGPGGAESYPAGMPNYNYSAQAFAVGDITNDGYPDIVSALFISYDGGNGLLVIPGNPNRL